MKTRRGNSRGGHRGGKHLSETSSVLIVEQPSRCSEETVDDPSLIEEETMKNSPILKKTLLEKNVSTQNVDEINAQGARVKKVASWLSNISVEEMATPAESMDPKLSKADQNHGYDSDRTFCSCCFTKDVTLLKFKLGDTCFEAISAKEAILKILPCVTFPLKDSDVICTSCFQTLVRTLRFMKMFMKVNYFRISRSHGQNEPNIQNNTREESLVTLTNGKEVDKSFEIECIVEDDEALNQEERYFDEISHYCSTKTQYKMENHSVFGESERQPFNKLLIIPKVQNDQLNHFLFDVHKDIAVFQHSSAFQRGDKRVLLLGNSHYKFCTLCEKRFALQDEFRKHVTNEDCKFSEQSTIEYFSKSPSLTSLKCDICGASFNRLSTKKSHMLKCVMFSCFYCDEILNESQLLEHSQSEHDDRKPFKCLKCKTAFRLYRKYKEHNCEKVICHKCGRVPVSIHTHICSLTTRSRPTTYRCHHCNEHIPTSELKDHIKLKHRLHYCDCKRGFFTKEGLEVHKQTSCQHVKQLCNICGKLLAKSHMKQHLQIHQQRVRSFECENCKKKFFSERRLREHVKKTHLYKNVVCEHCGIELREYSMKGHLLLKHNQSEQEMKCPVANCDKLFVRRDYLRRHVEKHQKSLCQFPLRRMIPANQTVICKFCLKEFKGIRQLKSHLVHHMPLSRLKCRYCAMTYSTYNSRRRHEKRFHNKTHEVFKCNTCWKIEPSKEKLNAHIKSVHKKKKYKCGFCSDAFSRHFQLSTHIIAEHTKPIDIENERNYVIHEALSDYMEVGKRCVIPPKIQNPIEYEVESNNESEECTDNDLEGNEDEDVIDESMYRLIKIDELGTGLDIEEKLYLQIVNDESD